MDILKVQCNNQEEYEMRGRRGVAYKAYKKPTKTRIYVSIEGESILEDLVNRHQRPSTLYKQLLPKAIKQLKAQGIEVPSDTKFNWNQKAGCKCGCSPGFIASNWIGKNVFITIGKAE